MSIMEQRIGNSMNRSMKGELDIVRKEYHGLPVVTLADIDQVHRRPEGTARRAFDRNRRFFIEGVDYFERDPYAVADEFGMIAPRGLKLFTQTGYLMIAKSFTDDLSWAIQRKLVNEYFVCHQQELTFMGTPVIPLSEAAKMLGLNRDIAVRRISRCNLGMADAILLEGRNLARFKQENGIRIQAKAIWVISRSGFEKLRDLTCPQKRALLARCS